MTPRPHLVQLYVCIQPDSSNVPARKREEKKKLIIIIIIAGIPTRLLLSHAAMSRRGSGRLQEHRKGWKTCQHKHAPYTNDVMDK